MRLSRTTIMRCGMPALIWLSVTCPALLHAHRESKTGEPSDPVQQWISGSNALMHMQGTAVENRAKDALPQPCRGRGMEGRPDVRIIQHDDTSAVVVVSGTSDGEPCEQYCFVERDEGSWRIVAVKTTPFLAELRSTRDALNGLEQRTAEQDAELTRYRLLTGADASLREYVVQHEATLQRIIDLYRAGKRSQALKLARTINIVEIDEADDEGSARIEFILGGIHDSAMGVLYAPRREDVPRMTPSGYIYVEEVTPTFSVFRSL